MSEREPIAIIGLGCVLPDAPNVDTFWDNLLAGKNSIRDVDPARWDPALYYDPQKAPDKTYTKIGAFVADDAFNGLDYRMPPAVVEQVDPCQRWALSATRQALEDAGYATGLRGNEGKAFDRDRCAVIIGNAMGGETNKIATKRLFWPEARAAVEADEAFQNVPESERAGLLDRAEARYKSTTVPVTEDTMPGHLSNVVAGRVANVFDLGGKNFTTDAACASSLAALDAATSSLFTGEADMVIWGGTDRSMDVTPYVQFSAIGALSPDGSRPFDKDANGFVMGEGCAMFILKRLGDAERDGDKIYAVVRGIGGSSDGKGKGITAPNPAGQVKAVRRAYEDAHVDPKTIGYLEAHGTSTPVGDPVELESVRNAIGDVPVGSIRVGSVKSNIGHLKAAAGAAGALKAILAIKHGVIPPSINVRELNPRIDWANAPFKVATEKTAWTADGPRRAAVSSFGFGGTNFHVVLEQHDPSHPWTPSEPMAQVVGSAVLDEASFRDGFDESLEAEPVVVSPLSAPALSSLSAPSYATGGPRLRDMLHSFTSEGIHAEQRVAFHLNDPADSGKKLALAQKAAIDPNAARLAASQGVFLGEGAHQGKVAFLFPGQGTQYVNMGRDLAKKYQVVADTFAEADAILRDELGCELTDILWPSPDTPDNRKASEEKLKLTEFTQPAVLAMDAAILRLLDSWGIKPDVVAGHSLGEYGALVAAGTLTLADALHAVAARGREMANVDLPDLGKMASISADWHVVEEALRDIDDYVICANKNCPSQTVIAGSTAGVEAAVTKLQGQGLQAMFLPVSAAFHSEIVAPASGPLRNVLGRLDVKPPQVDVITNVGAKPYPTDPDAIRDNLAKQVASPVDWIGTIERMHADGVTTFIEVGPKRALSGFVMDILDQPRAMFANHPKKGGIVSINELFAFLAASGLKPQLPELDSDIYTASFRDPKAAYMRASPTASIAAPAPTQPITAVAAPSAPIADPRVDIIADSLQRLTAELDALRGHPAPAVVAEDTTSIGISGISIGLPGQHKPLFDEGDWDRILAGENLITPLDAADRQRMVDKNIVRLVKGQNATFQPIDDIAQVIHLAARRGHFDLAEWGVDEELTNVLDKTSQYALAAGLEALKDAGIPLQRTYVDTSTGGRLPKDWKLPEPLRDETGIIFASAFPGYDRLIDEVSRAMTSHPDQDALIDELVQVIEDPGLRERVEALRGPRGDDDYQFNRKFLFNVLSMGHSQLAQFLGARGPNTQLNAACASTTQAIAMAEDWIRLGRAKRVIVVGADDATSDNMMEWIGSGFLASGAATTKADVTEAALPFDARRHGMIIGMGAVGLVIEATPDTEARGMRPIARLLATQVANSAYHGSRLDIDHIADQMQKVVAKGLGATSPSEVAGQTLFMSHETYTPARGGSAAAEIHALRATFGDAADKVIVANTKGFTGHPQGAGIEDAVALKCLQRGQVPPIPNLKERDEALGNLNLSKGGTYDVRYALRLAAGFGSQVAMTFTELVARENERVQDPARYDAWLAQATGIPGASIEIVNRTLRVIDAPVAAPVKLESKPVPEAIVADAGTLERVVAIVAEKTGYPTELLEPDLDLEADLGIDTVKQAELFGELRDTFGVPLDENLALSDYNTLRKVADYMGGSSTEAPAPASSGPDSLAQVTAVVAEKTGYPVELLEPDLDLEADLGIDTVKQAELFGELRELFGVPLDEGLSLADYNTLRKVADYMGQGSQDAPAPAAPVAEATPASPAPDASSDVLDQVIAVVAEKTGYPAELLEPELDLEADLGIDTVKQAELFGDLRERFNVPLDENLSLADYNTLQKVASYMGQGTAPKAAPAPEPSTPTESPQPTPSTVRRLVPALRAVNAKPAPVGPARARVVGNAPGEVLGALQWQEGDSPTALLCWSDATPRDLFDAAKADAATLDTIVVVTQQDGAHGLRAPRNATMGGLAGIGKAMQKEFPDAQVKVIDLHPDTDPRVIVDEIGRPRTEIAFDAKGRRHVIDVIPEQLADDRPDLAGKHIVVSGGGQGITATLLTDVAAGARFLLLGRTQVPDEATTWATWTADEWKTEEGRILAAMKAEGSVTPVQLKKAVDAKRKAAEIVQNLDAMRAAGAQADYAAVDVTDTDAVANAVDASRERYGPVHGVIHAAGIEISKQLADKPESQFDLVYGIKTAGLGSLLSATRDDPLELLIGFGSVAGRFGNLGQTDYSAANEAMAKRITQVAQARGIATAFTIAWGPWGEIGMATRGGIMTVLEQSGVTPITTAEGTQAWRREMAQPGIREAVVCGELGALDSDAQIREGGLPVPPGLPLLHRLDQVIPGERVVATIRLDRETQPYLDDHAIDGVPLLPGVFGIEAFAEAASVIAPEGTILTGARDVRFAAPLKQHKGPVEAQVEARITDDGIACKLTSRFIGPDGKARDPKTHFEATLLFGAPGESLRTLDVPQCDESVTDIYPPFFHGPAFQVLAAGGPIGEECQGIAQGPQGPVFANGDTSFMSHPLTTEALFQLCGLKALQEGTMSLPAGIERLDVFDVSSPPTRLWCRMDGERRFDAAACTDDGDVAIRLLGFEMINLGPAPAREPPVQELLMEAPDEEIQEISEPVAEPVPAAKPALSLESAPRPEARAGPTHVDAGGAVATLPEMDGVIFAGEPIPAEPPLGDARLSEQERDRLAAFSVPKRACDWVAGRLAAKAAARMAAPELGADEVTVDQDGSGAPILMVRGHRSPAKISITHRNQAIAAIADGPIGIDLENVEERAGTWWNMAFSSDEIDHLRRAGDEIVTSTCAWAAKEACLKRAGTGLQTPLHEVRVTLTDDGASVRGPWGDWGVRFFDLGGQVLAVTLETLDALTAEA